MLDKEGTETHSVQCKLVRENLLGRSRGTGDIHPTEAHRRECSPLWEWKGSPEHLISLLQNLLGSCHCMSLYVHVCRPVFSALVWCSQHPESSGFSFQAVTIRLCVFDPFPTFRERNTSQTNMGQLCNQLGQVKTEHVISKAVERQVSLRKEDRSEEERILIFSRLGMGRVQNKEEERLCCKQSEGRIWVLHISKYLIHCLSLGI